MKRNEVDKSRITPMMRQYLEIKEKNEDAIIFYRLGIQKEMVVEKNILLDI